MNVKDNRTIPIERYRRMRVKSRNKNIPVKPLMTKNIRNHSKDPSKNEIVCLLQNTLPKI
jgi:hypothetical protein